MCLYLLICYFSFADSKKSYATIGSLLSDEKCTKQWNQYYYSGIDLKYKKWLFNGEYVQLRSYDVKQDKNR